MNFRDALEQKLGLTSVTYKYNLSKDELFHEAIENDRGRVRLDGPDTDRKSFPTRLGVDGPLVFYTDPTCTGRTIRSRSRGPRSSPMSGGRTT